VLAEVAAGQMVGCPPMIQPMRVRSRFQSGPSPSPPPPPSPSPFTFTFHPGAEQLAADMAEALRVSQSDMADEEDRQLQAAINASLGR